MKKFFKLFFVPILLILTMWSCKKDEHRIYYKAGTNPVLTSSSTAVVVLDNANKSNEAIRFSWTNPGYQFTTGVSSQDVSYTLQFDTTGSNFSNPNMQEKSLSKDLNTSITVKELNTFMAKLGLAENLPHNMEVRLKSTLLNGIMPLYSNVIKFTATPFLDVAVPLPASGELYITGNALPSDWTNSPPPSQKFTRVSKTLFEITVPLTGGNSYTFLPTWGSWNDKYSIATKNDPNEVNGGDFQWQGNDILAPAASGNYKISVDFKVGKFTVTKM